MAIFATLLLASSIVTGCGPAAEGPPELPPPLVTVAKVVSTTTVDADEYTGQTEASEIVEVRARVFGYLKTIEFKDGDRVTEGQKLFTIEPDEYNAIHEQSKSRIDLQQARLELAQSKLDRNTRLLKDQAISQEDFEESAAAVKEAKAMIAAAIADANKTAVDLKYTTILAPISGRIDRAYITKGNLLTGGMSSGTLLTKIVQESPMYVYFDIDERSLLAYRKRLGTGTQEQPGSLRELGMKCYLQLADETEFTHEGDLDFASAEVDVNTGTVRIRGEFKNLDHKLVSGLFVRVRVPIGKPYQVLMVPEQSLATDQNIKFVYVVGADDIARRKSVVLGELRDGMRIIKSGLTASDRVIVRGVQRVKPDLKVTTQVQLEAPAPAETPAPAATETPPVEPAQPEPAAPQPAAPAAPSTTSPAEASE